MPFADSSNIRVAYVPEATYGVTPATPTFRELRVTGGGLKLNKSTVVSDERRADRNVSDLIQTGQDWAGDFNAELSYGSFDDILEALLMGTWTTNVLKNGTTAKSFTVEETRKVAGTPLYARWSGTRINSGKIGVTNRSKMTFDFNAMATAETLATAIVTGATYTAASTRPVFNASEAVSGLSLTGTGLTATPRVKSLSFDIANNLRTRPVVGSKLSAELGSGRFEVSGTAEVYFESHELYQAILDHGFGAFAFTAGFTTAEKYSFLLPKCVFGNGNVTAGGGNDDVMVSLPFQAVYDSTEACTLKIARAVA